LIVRAARSSASPRARAGQRAVATPTPRSALIVPL
jgi:hypothetical protein